MDSTIYTVEMVGTGGGNTQYLFITLGFGADTTVGSLGILSGVMGGEFHIIGG